MEFAQLKALKSHLLKCYSRAFESLEDAAKFFGYPIPTIRRKHSKAALFSFSPYGAVLVPLEVSLYNYRKHFALIITPVLNQHSYHV